MQSTADMPDAGLRFSNAIFRDPLEQEAGLAGWQQRYTKMGKGAYRGSVTRVALAGLTVIREEVDGMMQLESCAPAGCAVIGLPRGQGPTRVNGWTVVQPLIYQGNGASVDCLQDMPGQSIMVQVEVRHLPESIKTLGPRLMLAQNCPSAAALRQWLGRLIGHFSRSAFAPSREVVEKVSHRIIERVAEVLDELALGHSLEALKFSHSYDLYRRVFTLVERGEIETLSVAGVARQLSVPDFIIRAAFKDVLGIPPRLWLQQKRLALAHRVLRDGRDRRTIAEIALDHGFNHYSRFSHYYEQTYGKLPSHNRA